MIRSGPALVLQGSPVPYPCPEVPRGSSADGVLPGQRVGTAHAAVSVPKPCVAGSIPAGGTTTHQAKPALASINAGQCRSCVLPPSAAIRPPLPPFAKPLRNGTMDVLTALDVHTATLAHTPARRAGQAGGRDDDLYLAAAGL
jgi:hypothetical protein